MTDDQYKRVMALDYGAKRIGIAISDPMMIFATPNGVYQSYPSATILNSRRGSFNLDLSEKWQQLYNSSLPQRFVFQLVLFVD